MNDITDLQMSQHQRVTSSSFMLTIRFVDTHAEGNLLNIISAVNYIGGRERVIPLQR